MWGKLLIAALMAAAPSTPALASDSDDRRGWREHRERHGDSRWHGRRHDWDDGKRWKHRRYYHHYRPWHQYYGYGGPVYGYWYVPPPYYGRRYAYRDPWEYCWQRRYWHSRTCRRWRYYHGW